MSTISKDSSTHRMYAELLRLVAEDRAECARSGTGRRDASGGLDFAKPEDRR